MPQSKKPRPSKITKPKPKPSKKPPRRSSNTKKSRLTSPTPSASESDRMATEEEENDDDDDDQSPAPSSEKEDEPDFILAEISHPPVPDLSSSETSIPTALLHRIMAEFWRHQEDSGEAEDGVGGEKKKKKRKKGKGKTKITGDALEVFRMYIEVFVREGIKRCEIDAKSRDGSGWLEVDGLERVAVQLCLDF